MSGESPAELPGASGSFSAHDAVFEWMQDIAPYGIFTTDASFRIQSWNQWLASRSGWQAKDLIGKTLTEEFPELVARRLQGRYENAMNGEISVLSAALHRHLLAFPTSVSNAGGPYMLQTVRIAPLVIDGKIVGTITIIEDVTERETHAMALQRQRQQDYMLSQALSVLLRSSDPMQDISDLFPSFTPSLGVDAFFTHVFEPQGNALKLSAAGGVLSRLKEELASFPLGDGPCGECLVKREPVVIGRLQENTDSRYREVRTSGMKLFASFPVVIAERLHGVLSVGSYEHAELPGDEAKFLSILAQYLAIAMERVRREEDLRGARKKLQEHAESLEIKVQERTVLLHDSIARLESFSYTVAHDLRAPIRTLQGYSEILTEDYGALLPDEGKRTVARLLKASQRLDALTKDLLRFSKIGRENVEMESISIIEIVEELCSYTPALQAALTLHKPLGTVWAQHTLLQQCLANLFENALKFHDRDKELRITIRSERIDGPTETGTSAHAFHPATFGHPKNHPRADSEGRAWLRIWVEDNGIGIPDHARAKIFGIFERSIGSEKIEGTGIGLAIVARAMHQMGGTCGVESELGNGSRFWLELPRGE